MNSSSKPPMLKGPPAASRSTTVRTYTAAPNAFESRCACSIARRAWSLPSVGTSILSYICVGHINNISYGKINAMYSTASQFPEYATQKGLVTRHRGNSSRWTGGIVDTLFTYKTYWIKRTSIDFLLPGYQCMTDKFTHVVSTRSDWFNRDPEPVSDGPDGNKSRQRAWGSH